MDGNKSGGKASGRIAKGGTAQGGSDIYKIVKRNFERIRISFISQMIMERQFQPVIIFSLCRRGCEQHVMSMSKLDFNTEEEKEIVEEVFKKAILFLREEDRILLAIELILPLLQQGIVVHHSKLLPIIKELVELLIQERLVKALFATETFAMGLNMPAKTVVFTSVKKWDGDSNRYIGSGEYIQALVEEEEEKQKLECSGNEKANTYDLDNDPISKVFGSDRKKNYCHAISSTSFEKQVKLMQASKAIADKNKKEDFRQWSSKLQNQVANQ